MTRTRLKFKWCSLSNPSDRGETARWIWKDLIPNADKEIQDYIARFTLAYMGYKFFTEETIIDIPDAPAKIEKLENTENSENMSVSVAF